MTALLTPSSNLYIPSTVNRCVIKTNTLGTAISGTYTPASPGSGFILLGVDMTATQSEPVQCFAYCQLGASGPIFYWDSQSTGEGLGVTFGWRGQLMVDPGTELICAMTAGASIELGVIAWGLVGQIRTSVNET